MFAAAPEQGVACHQCAQENGGGSDAPGVGDCFLDGVKPVFVPQRDRASVALMARVVALEFEPQIAPEGLSCVRSAVNQFQRTVGWNVHKHDGSVLEAADTQAWDPGVFECAVGEDSAVRKQV
ncbi:hypothetical protein ACIA8G_21550 [Lentzea sp. NPDC051213]|uniref:hypothetical protein n=1 Tax=Lentzea sp. NPDC051213 TaxID=3364126 RepID=UPI00378FE962